MPSETHWKNYSDIFLEDFKDAEHKDLLNYVRQRDIAAVIDFHIGSNYKTWLKSRIDALNGKTPNECLTTHEGTEQLKDMLMKIH
ncbi:antitoxin Xre/MbcA/ParS toxin-binding domain-containing protein [Microbulbifer sp.]|uniref:antitoxin Xre/MbcA/ParS toxin-binding domain-containing protein n=1 Tax=Microbulbifer sp. TaxID=1908541 RepID=UPI0025838DF8|nr:antitoxin Xre/MbcA/ParS toxin-binding domain-containing protein [Microbulbifer sp.]